eukprot:350428-Chlamydomonas_euryale.AAC.8
MGTGPAAGQGGGSGFDHASKILAAPAAACPPSPVPSPAQARRGRARPPNAARCAPLSWCPAAVSH